MERLATINGRVWVFGDEINTDLMYPHVCYTLPEDERPAYTMWANRPGWAMAVRPGDILVAGKNFGIGSSRPAAANLLGLGISCAVAENVNGLFLRNAINYGLPVASCRGVTKLVREGEELELDLDRGRATNVATGESLSCTVLPAFLKDIVESGGIIKALRARGLLEDEPL